MRFQIARAREALTTSLWVAPLGSILAALGLAELLVSIDHSLDPDIDTLFLFKGEAESARELLSTIASSLLNFTGLVFTVTILVLQTASAQFSPRVLRTFLGDRTTQAAMGTFVGSFVYAMAVLPWVRNATPGYRGFVPALSVSVALSLVLVSVLVFVRYIHHMAHSIRALNIIARVAEEGRRVIERLPALERAGPPVRRTPDAERVIDHDRPPGIVMSLDEATLVRIACEHDVVIRIVPTIGAFLPRGAPLFAISGPGRVGSEELRESVAIGPERTPDQDFAFCLRQLVDIALRALSPSLNDPTTAVSVLDQVHDLLRSLAGRALPDAARHDASGSLRLLVQREDWNDLVRLSLEEVRRNGANSVQVVRRIHELLDDVTRVAPPERRMVLDEQRAALEEAAIACGTSGESRATGSR